MKRPAILMALSLPAILFLTGCTSPQASSGPTTKGPILDPIPPRCVASASSNRVAQLLDQRSYSAAEGLFQKFLEDHPDDARLHVEYVRYLLLTSNLAYSGYIASPILKDGRYWASNVANEAGQRASQLDTSCKELLAEVIHTNLLTRIKESLKKNTGIIGEPGSFYYPRPNSDAVETGFSSSMIGLGWLALEASPGRSAKFLDQYRELMELAITKGKVATAAMLGNLLGDLEKGDISGDLDFAYACDAFARALANFQQASDQTDWIAHTIDIFRDIFQTDLEGVTTAAPESFNRLQQVLGSRGYSLLDNSSSSYGLQQGPTGSSPGQP